MTVKSELKFRQNWQTLPLKGKKTEMTCFHGAMYTARFIRTEENLLFILEVYQRLTRISLAWLVGDYLL